MGRPNELTGQVRPNTLSSQDGRRQTLGQTSAQPGWTSRGPTSPTASSAPSSPTAQSTSTGRMSAPTTATRPRARRSSSRVWSLFVLAIIAFNLLPRILSSGFTLPQPTTVPAPATRAPATPAGTRLTGVTTDQVKPGDVVFGTAEDADCTVAGAATQFKAGTKVWWYAHLNAIQAGDAALVTILKLDGTELERGGGPDATAEEWEGLCAGEPFSASANGHYTFEIWTAGQKDRLASGEYQLTP